MISFFDDKHSMMIPGLTVTVRSTVVSTRAGVVVISPIDFSNRQRAEIMAMGHVAAIIEPNLFHSAYAIKAKNWFPRAECWGAPGAAEKHPKVGWNKTLHQDPWPFAPDLQTVLIAGAPKLAESVFFHPATKTLIVTDLVFNMHRTRGLLAPILLRLFRFYGKFIVGPFWPKMIEDRTAVRTSLNEILKLDFERIVMAHGDIVTKNAKETLRKALLDRAML